MSQTENSAENATNKWRNLILGILFDGIGMLSFGIPILGEVTIDLIWAPISAFLLAKLYKGTAGKIGGVISFVEEIFPFTDVIPTFTLMWCYTYLFQKDSTKKLN